MHESANQAWISAEALPPQAFGEHDHKRGFVLLLEECPDQRTRAEHRKQAGGCFGDSNAFRLTSIRDGDQTRRPRGDAVNRHRVLTPREIRRVAERAERRGMATPR